MIFLLDKLFGKITFFIAFSTILIFRNKFSICLSSSGTQNKELLWKDEIVDQQQTQHGPNKQYGQSIHQLNYCDLSTLYYRRLETH